MKPIFTSSSIILLAIIMSCSNRTNHQSKTNIQQVFDTVSIDITGRELPNYYYTTGIIINSELINWVGYNNFEHCLDFYDLTTKKLTKKLQLDQQGPNGIKKFGRFIFASEDSIIIQGNTCLYKIDTSGTVLERRTNSDLVNYGEFIFINMMEVGFPENNIAYENGKLYAYILPPESMFWEKDFYKKPIIASIDISTGLVRLLPIYYPEEASPNRLFGYLLKPYIFCFDDELIYNFPFSSKVYRYDMEDEKLDIFDIPSDLTKNESTPLDFSLFKGNRESFAISEHFLNALHFHKIIYDPFNELFYRVHTIVPDKNDVTKQRNNYLSIFDKDFQKVGEIELDKKLFINNYVPSENGVIFQIIPDYNNVSDANKLKFCRIKFNIQ